MTLVKVPTTPEELDQVRALMRAFIAWHRQRHLEDIHLIDQYFDAAAFEDELVSLPGKYAPPRGSLLLATHDGGPAGCVALREIDAHAGEMKRMFVYTHLHGKGVGHALAHALIGQARDMGYRCLRLDTSIRQEQAITLYRRLGFNVIEPYYELPESMRGWLVFMELALQPRTGA
jgi:GNAT superfamily N-acetyltransferase